MQRYKPPAYSSESAEGLPGPVTLSRPLNKSHRSALHEPQVPRIVKSYVMFATSSLSWALPTRLGCHFITPPPQLLASPAHISPTLLTPPARIPPRIIPPAPGAPHGLRASVSGNWPVHGRTDLPHLEGPRTIGLHAGRGPCWQIGRYSACSGRQAKGGRCNEGGGREGATSGVWPEGTVQSSLVSLASPIASFTVDQGSWSEGNRCKEHAKGNLLLRRVASSMSLDPQTHKRLRARLALELGRPRRSLPQKVKISKCGKRAA